MKNEYQLMCEVWKEDHLCYSFFDAKDACLFIFDESFRWQHPSLCLMTATDEKVMLTYVHVDGCRSLQVFISRSAENLKTSGTHGVLHFTSLSSLQRTWTWCPPPTLLLLASRSQTCYLHRCIIPFVLRPKTTCTSASSGSGAARLLMQLLHDVPEQLFLFLFLFLSLSLSFVHPIYNGMNPGISSGFLREASKQKVDQTMDKKDSPSFAGLTEGSSISMAGTPWSSDLDGGEPFLLRKDASCSFPLVIEGLLCAGYHWKRYHRAAPTYIPQSLVLCYFYPVLHGINIGQVKSLPSSVDAR